MTTYTELQAQIKALQLQAEQVRKNELSSAIADIKAKMLAHGVTTEDLGGTGKVKRRMDGRALVPAKYRDPATGSKWSGRGKSPTWIAGKDRDKFLIK